MQLYQQIFFTTLALAFGILHLFIYVYNRRLKSNLYFALFLCFYTLNIFFDYQSMLMSGDGYSLLLLRLRRSVLPFFPIFILLFLYTIFESKIPLQFWVISLGLVITGFFAVLKPLDNFKYIQIFLVLAIIEAIKEMYFAIKNKRDGAWIIASGFIVLFAFSLYDTLMELNVIHAYRGIENGYPFGFVGLITLMSIYLARDFAITNKRILFQERETRRLELEHRLLEEEAARKSRELEEAREFQFSMLPKGICSFPGLDICFHMSTASEVGGDYYDYLISDDGILTITLGDATGHGMRSGMMVTVIKSLFISEGEQSGTTEFLEKANHVINLNNSQIFKMVIFRVIFLYFSF